MHNAGDLSTALQSAARKDKVKGVIELVDAGVIDVLDLLGEHVEGEDLLG